MGMLDAENANRSSKSTSKSSSSGTKSSGGGTSNHASEREIDRSTGSRSTTSRSSSASSDRPDRASTSSVGSDRREIDRSLSERSVGSERSTGLNSAGNRATGAGPMSSSNRTTTATGFSPTIGGHATEREIDRSLGARTTPATPTGGLMTSARASEIKSMQDYGQYRATDLASRARAAENKSMADLARESALATIRSAEAGVTNPYNRLVGGGPNDYADLTSLTVREAIAMAGGLKAQGHLSNVLGGYQFKNTTLANAATKLGVLDEKFTPEMQDKLAQELFQQRADRATVNGQIDVDAFANELAREWASLATKDGKSYYDRNGIDKAGVDYATVRGMAKDLVDHGIVSVRTNGRSSPDLPSTVASLPSARPSADRFAESYLGGSKASGGLSPKQVAAYEDYGLNRGFAPINPVTRVAETVPRPAPVSAPNRAATGGGTGPVVGDAMPVPDPVQKPGSPILANGIDVLAGMLPGVGTAATVLNAGLALTGNRTIGQRIADDFANGGGKNGSVLMGSGGSDRPDRVKKPKDDQKVTPPTPERFEETYLAFVDPVKRPTPAEKWGAGFSVSGQS